MKFFWQFVIFCLCAAIMAAVVYPLVAPTKTGREYLPLQHLKMIGLATNIYLAEHDDRLPLAVNWADALSPYISRDTYFSDFDIDSKDPSNGFAFYSPVSGIQVTKVLEPNTIPMIFVSDLRTRNAAGTLSSLPSKPRNRKGHAVLFVDTSVDFRDQSWASTVPAVLMK